MTNHPRPWPAWAPPELIERREWLLTLAGGGALLDFQSGLVQTIETLCTASEMERAWAEIARHARRDDYHTELAEEITKARMVTAICHGMTAQEKRKKRRQAANAARKLRENLSDLGFADQPVFPILGTQAMQLAIEHFLDGRYSTIPTDSPAWAREATLLSAVMMREHPGVGSIGALLDRMAGRLESDDPAFWPAHRDGSDEARARHLCIAVGRMFLEVCGTPLYGTTATICELFFPTASIQTENVRALLNAAGIRQARQS